MCTDLEIVYCSLFNPTLLKASAAFFSLSFFLIIMQKMYEHFERGHMRGLIVDDGRRMDSPPTLLADNQAARDGP